ncbi:Spondin-1 [Fragariocoptes setiger]|uniref:Spondin-1 n=1 Tax=Fragariocoptes setiger TaxID=1670756 RepID=A0ABQ7SC51_9ACAR|nr:Spondin-1 [Fragariocoptes setiger]
MPTIVPIMASFMAKAICTLSNVCIVLVLFMTSNIYCDRRHQAFADYPVLEQCCACDEAKYELVFEGLWSKYTHPKDFPTNHWLAHLGDIVGASHSADFKMWDYNGYASEGVKELAEQGSTKKLESELKLESNKIRTIVKARDLWYPNLNSKTFAVFRTDRYHHLVSILSKVAPSPDWMVGVSSLELCQRDCTWAPQRTMDLYLWDAGTESSPTYISMNQPTKPQERIHPLHRYVTETLTNNAANQSHSFQNGSAVLAVDSEFRDGSQGVSRPFAKLTVTRQRIYEKSCQASFTASPLNQPLNPDSSQLNSDQIKATNGAVRYEDSHQVTPQVPAFNAAVSSNDSIDCRVTNWTPWTPCSVSCGQGVRTRTRSFVHEKAHIMGCKTELIEKEACESECIGNVSCTSSAWSEWSECSVSCGRGHRTRTRVFLGVNQTSNAHGSNQVKKHVCSSMELVDRELCIGPLGETCHDDIAEITDIRCEVTKWSDWSPCSTPCGKGVRIRIRRYKHPHASEHCRIALYQKISCIASDRADCPAADISEVKDHTISLEQTINILILVEICMKPRETGPCKGAFLRWYYDHHKGACMKFLYGGCRGNHNNFERYQDCERQCQIPLAANRTSSDLQQQPRYNERPNNVNNKNRSGKNNKNQQQQQVSVPINPNLPVIDCVHSDWSPWSACSSPCGKGRRTRTRYIIQSAQNGGKPCDKKLVQRQKCKDLPPCPTGNINAATNDASPTRIYSTSTTTHNSMDPMASDDDEDIKYARIQDSLNSSSYQQPSELLFIGCC